MHILILTLILAALAYLPHLWVKSVLKKHSRTRQDLPGTGAQLAQHSIKRFELDGVSVAMTDPGRDHYDPQSATVRLGPDNHDGRSLAAVAVAAHEVGHAIQFHRGEKISQLRKRYLPTAIMLKKLGVLSLTLAPIIAMVTRTPASMLLVVALSVLLQLLGALAYLIVLPEEWDASFKKALPILLEGEYVISEDIPALRKILKAAAYTYLAGALADLINIGRWLLILRR